MTDRGNVTLEEYLQIRKFQPVVKTYIKEAWKAGQALGFEDGYNQSAADLNKYNVNLMLALMCIYLHDNCGWGGTRCFRMIKGINQMTIERGIDVDEVMKECREKTGLMIDMDDDGLGMD